MKMKLVIPRYVTYGILGLLIYNHFEPNTYLENLRTIYGFFIWCGALVIGLFAIFLTFADLNVTKKIDEKSLKNIAITNSDALFNIISWIIVGIFGILGEWFLFIPLAICRVSLLMMKRKCRQVLKDAGHGGVI